MFFYLDYIISPVFDINIQKKGKEELILKQPNILYLEDGAQRQEIFNFPEGKLILLGDPIFKNKEEILKINFVSGASSNMNQDALYQEIKGHYYWFFFQSGSLECGTSFGSIFPIYYYKEQNKIQLSSSSFYLAEANNLEEKNARNLLERLLFNYPFFNSTWWQGVELLEAHHYLSLSNNQIKIESKFDISNYFGEVENTSRQGLNDLVSFFQEETAQFFPEAPFAISLTGGFDGRTLVASARKAHKSFTTYSFGKPNTADILFPQQQAKTLGINYQPILLDHDYLHKKALESSISFMDLTEYNGNLGRPHYYYATEQLSKQVDYIITGNFGSELFRALHLPGVMMSECLINIFSAKDNSWKDFLKVAADAWGKDMFNEELDALITDLEAYLKDKTHLEPNHQFYHFVFNEIFRKYFGPELIMQSQFFNNRTPYLNLKFFIALNRTIWSGVHSRLFEKAKNKRMKGQMFYAAFIKQADRDIYNLLTSKGYSPSDVLEYWRLPILASRIAYNKYLKNKDIEEDENASDAVFKQYYKKIAENIIKNSDSAFIHATIKQSLTEIPQDIHIRKWVKFYSIANGWITSPNSVIAL